VLGFESLFPSQKRTFVRFSIIELMDKKSRGLSLILLIVTLSLAATAALYSLVGSTDEYGNFKVNRNYQLFLILMTLVSAAVTIRSFFIKK